MTEHELITLRNRLYGQIRKNDSPRLDLQLHAVQGELKDRGFITKNKALHTGIEITRGKATMVFDVMDSSVHVEGAAVTSARKHVQDMLKEGTRIPGGWNLQDKGTVGHHSHDYEIKHMAMNKREIQNVMLRLTRVK